MNPDTTEPDTTEPDTTEPDTSEADTDDLGPMAVGMAMWRDDQASVEAGLHLDFVGEGTARLSMVVSPRHVNGLGVCHGGYLFLLADSAMAFASNSRNQRAVAAAAQIDFVRPAMLGDQLVATATERSRGKRTGLFDVEVKRGGELIALFHGRTSTTGGSLVIG